MKNAKFERQHLLNNIKNHSWILAKLYELKIILSYISLEINDMLHWIITINTKNQMILDLIIETIPIYAIETDML